MIGMMKQKSRLSQLATMCSSFRDLRMFSAIGAEESVSLPSSKIQKYTPADWQKLKPKEIVEQLNNHIVGQQDAKRAVAVALRNRWRRQNLPEDLRQEVSPKNILMVGPTGCGKTEIARRLAKLSEAPFVKVEATKFTEVGFHGKDVDSIIRDLIEISISQIKKHRMERAKDEVQAIVEERLLDHLTGENLDGKNRDKFLEFLRNGDLDERMITVEIASDRGQPALGAFTLDTSAVIPSISELTKLGKSLMSQKATEKKEMTIAEARPVIEEIEMEKLIDMNDITKEAITQAEQNGIVFIDEIDKVCNVDGYKGADASSEGVQRDLLPLIEGCTVSTKHGNVNTDHILFIGSGAFHTCKPSDLLAELQGRLPIRVELKGLTENDLYRILTEPVANIIRQQIELLKTEEVKLEFTSCAIKEIAKVAAEVNRTVENIGARRLHTIVERVVEVISFDAPEKEGSEIKIDAEYVKERVGDLLSKSDLSKFIL